MYKTSNKLILRAIIEFIVLVVILSLTGYLVYYKMDYQLKRSLEESVALQSKSVAVGLRNQFEEKFHRLQAAAHLVSIGKVSLEDIDDVFLVGAIGEEMGVVTEKNDPLRGGKIPERLMKRLSAVFQGENVVIYDNECGLIFAVPVRVNEQKCMLYNSNPTEWVRKTFHATSYNGEGTIILINDTDNWMVLSEGAKHINTKEEPDSYWATLWQKFNDEGKGYTAMYRILQGESQLMYIAEISEKYHFVIAGYAPWRAVAVGIDYIYMIMVVTFFIILLMILLAVRYKMKNREAKSLAEEKILADSANKAKSEFLSNMSHEIRTPINAIMGMDEMIIRESKDPSIQEYAENLQNAARNLLGLVNDILDFSKIEAGKMEIIPIEYHLSSMLNDLVNMIQKRAEKKGLDLRVHACSTMPSVLFGDEIRIKQVITNILTNAVKYTEEGSVTLNITSRPIDNENINLCVSVNDTGIGIKEEDIKKLFSAFERIEEERNRNIEGTGLGMNITQKLLKLMNSKLQVESVYGKGSTFAFQVEQKIVNSEPIGDFQESYRRSLNRHKEYHESFTAPDARILVVDDTVMNLTVVKGLLKQTKIQIDTTINGADCIAATAKKKYDIIFLDHRMPGMDGIETLNIMKKMTNNPNYDTPVICLTANAISGAREQYIAAGFRDYLTKPINSTQLENLIIEYLAPEKVHATSSTENSYVDEESLPEWLTKVEGLNTNEGIEHCGSVEAYLDALTVFYESIEIAVYDIENYYKAEDWKNYTTKVHALKSTAKVIGAMELSEKARRLEDAGNSGYINEIQEDTEPLLNLYRSYVVKLAALTQNDDRNADKPLIDEEELTEAYETMKEVAKSFDYDTLMFVIQSLEEYRLPDNEIERYKKIKAAASILDWTTISQLLTT